MTTMTIWYSPLFCILNKTLVQIIIAAIIFSKVIINTMKYWWRWCKLCRYASFINDNRRGSGNTERTSLEKCCTRSYGIELNGLKQKLFFLNHIVTIWIFACHNNVNRCYWNDKYKYQDHQKWLYHLKIQNRELKFENRDSIVYNEICLPKASADLTETCDYKIFWTKMGSKIAKKTNDIIYRHVVWQQWHK